MGEAMSEGGVFVHAKARALLEVVRLAFEGGIGFETNAPDVGCATAPDDPERPDANGLARSKTKLGKELLQHPAPHQPHRPTSTGSGSRLVLGGPCTWCAVTATPQWRRPRGTNKLLCNACGIFFTRYGRLPEKTHQAYAAETRAESAALSPVNVSTPAPEGAEDALPSTVHQVPDALGPMESVDEPVPDIAVGAEPRTFAQAALGPGQQQQGQVQWQQQQQQKGDLQEEKDKHQPPLPLRTAPASSVPAVSPHKRKAAPQAEAELLRCLEDDSADGALHDADRSAWSAYSGAPPLPPPPPRATLQQPPHPLDFRPAGAVAGAGAAAAAAETAATAADLPTMLTVAPLDLGLQGMSHVHQLVGRLAPGLAELTAPPPLCLHVPESAAAAAAVAAAAAAAAAAAGRGFGLPPGLLAATGLGGLPPGLLGWPLALPGVAGLRGGSGSGSGAGSGAGATIPRPLYARPPKRQERLQAGESEDSNASTDSHHGAALHGDAAMSYDEDEGMMATAVAPATAAAGPAVTATTSTTALTSASAATASSAAGEVVDGGGGLSCSPPAVSTVHLAVPYILGRHSTALVPSLSAVGGGHLSLPPLAPFAPPSAALAELAPLLSAVEGQAQPQQQLQPHLPQQLQQQVMLLQARRSKGPRSRAVSTTPPQSSSVQS